MQPTPNTPHDPNDRPDGSFAEDLPRLMSRRAALILGAGVLGGAGVFGYRSFAQSNQTGTAADGSVCIGTPAETAGPFPGDGTNAREGQTVNILTENGVMRQDIRASIGGLTPVADGVALELEITLLDVNAACAPLANHAVYLWHCDALGGYSLYSDIDRNYLRGLQVSDAQGKLRFTTILPGAYQGRWPHIHFEVFSSAEAAVNGDNALLTSQFALPEAACIATYADPRYGDSAANFYRTPLARDGIFRDNTPEQLAAQTLSMTGDPAAGYSAQVTVGLG